MKKSKVTDKRGTKAVTKSMRTPEISLFPKISQTQLMKTDAIFKNAAEKDPNTLMAKTRDGFDNFLSRVGLNNDNALSASVYIFNLMTRNRIQLEAAYRGSWVVGAVVDSVADDMTRAGIEIITNEADADIKDLQNKIADLKIWDSLNDGLKWSRLYGGSIAVLQIAGQDLSTPLNLDSITQGSFLGLTIYDRWQLNPVLNKPIMSGPDLGLPSIYQIVVGNNPDGAVFTGEYATGQIPVHHSRIIRFGGVKLPYFQAITEMMWGESILERLWDRLIAFDNVTMSSASLVDRANLRTVGIEGLRQIIAAGGKAVEGLQAMFEMMRLMQVNEGLTLIDKNDEFTSTAYSFAGLSDMILQFGQQLAGASGIPLVRLFGQSPSGLSSTGESDLRTYYDNINAQQNAVLRQGWTKLLEVLWRSVYGKEPPKDLVFTFAPLWQTSNLDKATIAKTNAESIIGAYEAGLINTPSAMKELRERSGDTGLFSNISDEEISEAEKADKENPPDPGELVNGPGEKPSEELESPKDPVKNIDEAPKPKRSWARFFRA